MFYIHCTLHIYMYEVFFFLPDSLWLKISKCIFLKVTCITSSFVTFFDCFIGNRRLVL